MLMIPPAATRVENSCWLRESWGRDRSGEGAVALFTGEPRWERAACVGEEAMRRVWSAHCAAVRAQIEAEEAEERRKAEARAAAAEKAGAVAAEAAAAVAEKADEPSAPPAAVAAEVGPVSRDALLAELAEED